MQFAAAQIFKGVWKEMRYSDITLTITDKNGDVSTRQAHRLVLEFFSEKFDQLLRSHPDAKTLSISIPCDMWVFDLIMKSLYQASSRKVLDRCPAVDLISTVQVLGMAEYLLRHVVKTLTTTDTVLDITNFLLRHSFGTYDTTPLVVGLICTYSNEMSEHLNPRLKEGIQKVSEEYPVWCHPDNKQLKALLQEFGTYRKFCFQKDTCVWGIPSISTEPVSKVGNSIFNISRNLTKDGSEELYLNLSHPSGVTSVYVCDPCGEPTSIHPKFNADGSCTAVLDRYKHRVYQSELIRVVYS